MHDEDNAIGISVKNPKGESWTAYGDKKALDFENTDNKDHCIDAVQASANEIYEAFKTRRIPPPESYQAWSHAPTLESARGPQALAMLFDFHKKRRSEIKKRRLWEFITNWTYLGTIAEIIASGLWNYPIKLDGLKNVLIWTSFASIAPRSGHMQVFYQKPEGTIVMLEHVDGKQTEGISVFGGAALFTPLAAVSWNDGQEIRVYYVDKQYILQEYCYSGDKDSWFSGDLGNFKIQVAPNTSISAIQYNDDQGGVHIHWYFQDMLSFAIQEWQNHGKWSKGASDLPIALSGSSLAAACYVHNGLQIRLYYQTGDLSLKEQCFSQGGSWYPGDFSPGRFPGRVPIAAVGYEDSGDPTLRVYWRNLKNEIVETNYLHSKWGSSISIVEGLNSGQLTVAQWSSGKELGLYYQDSDNSVTEMYCNDRSGGWTAGPVVASA